MTAPLAELIVRFTALEHSSALVAARLLVIALTVSWVSLVADYTRFSRTPRSAFIGVGVGYLLPTLFQFGFGAVLVLSHPSITGPTDVLTTVAAGGVSGRLAM